MREMFEKCCAKFFLENLFKKQKESSWSLSSEQFQSKYIEHFWNKASLEILQ